MMIVDAVISNKKKESFSNLELSSQVYLFVCYFRGRSFGKGKDHSFTTEWRRYTKRTLCHQTPVIGIASSSDRSVSCA